MKERIRESNYELLRIITMIMIIVWHVIVHGMVDYNTSGVLNLAINFIKVMVIVHVDTFILITGYFQSKSEFKFSKLFSINNASWFYRIVIIITLALLNITDFSRIEIINNFIPIDLGFYWFVDIYLILYCISPFLNYLIKKMDQQTFKKLLVGLFILFSIITTITRQQAIGNSGGYSITNFVLLYFIGAYLRLYKFELWKFLKIDSTKKKQLIYFALFCGLFILNFLFFNFGRQLADLGTIAKEVSTYFTNATFSYDNPLVILGAVTYFLWFGCFSFKNKFVNKIATLVFGVYLIHDNPYVRVLIYKFFGLQQGIAIYSFRIIPKIFLLAIAIFVVCAIIEWIRQLIFKGISYLKISKMIKRKFNNYVLSLKNDNE